MQGHFVSNSLNSQKVLVLAIIFQLLLKSVMIGDHSRISVPLSLAVIDFYKGTYPFLSISKVKIF